MAVLIGAVYVWGLFGLLLGLGALHLSSWFVGAGLGVVFALGLARLAERHSPKKLAWGVLGPNPGWGWLLFLIVSVINAAQPDLSGEGGAYAEASVVFFAFGAFVGVVATFLCLGLASTFNFLQASFYLGPLVLLSKLNRRSQIVLGTVLSWQFGTVLGWAEGVHFPQGWIPSLFETYALLGLSLAGIIWSLSHEESVEKTATV